MDIETKPLWTTTREAMGRIWSLELWPESDMNAEGTDLGSARSSRLRIRVNAAVPMDTRETILLHEIIEMVDADLDLKLEHATVDRLEKGIFAFLRGFGLWQDFPWPDREEPSASLQ